MAKHGKAEMRRRRKRRRMIRGALEIAGMLAMLALVCALLLRGLGNGPRPDAAASATPEPAATDAAPTEAPAPEPTATPAATPEPTATPEPEPVSILLTAVGDCTLGGDMKGSSEGRFLSAVTAEDGSIDYGYCFRNVEPIFAADDVTLVNLEVVLTDSSDYLRRDDKIYIMRGRPDYVNMLTDSSVEVCNIANNHMTDFGDEGIRGMAELLEENGLGYCGYGYTHLMTVKGVRFGFVGINYWTTKPAEFEEQVRSMREECDVLVVSIHWGTELEYYATAKQQEWGKLAVDYGADLVIGHHPHVVEGLEEYKGVNIVYSLGNFCFGGNSKPKDQDTFIYQHEFIVDPATRRVADNRFRVIPCKITSVPNDARNNYQPTPIADPADQRRVLEKLETYSRKLSSPLALLPDSDS